jgi:hypothetical protein
LIGAATSGWLTTGGTLAAGAAALLALTGAAITICDNRRTARRRTTHEYIGRLLDPELLPFEARITAFLRGGIRPPEIPALRWRYMGQDARRNSARAFWIRLNRSSSLADRRMLLEILAYPNLLEGIASMYNGDLLDREMVKAQLEVDARSFWHAAGWWIAQLREENGDDTFRDIEVMIDDFDQQSLPEWYPS